MTRLLFWVLIILGALIAARLLARHKTSAKVPPVKSKQSAEPIVRCAHCGVYLPHSQAVHQHGQTWCSLEHAQWKTPQA